MMLQTLPTASREWGNPFYVAESISITYFAEEVCESVTL